MGKDKPDAFEKTLNSLSKHIDKSGDEKLKQKFTKFLNELKPILITYVRLGESLSVLDNISLPNFIQSVQTDSVTYKVRKK